MPPFGRQSRRGFVASLAGGLLGMLGTPRVRPTHRCHLSAASGPHPDPRRDVDASQVLTAEQLTRAEHVIPLYDGIRAIPHIADGIRCKCGCADLEGFRSLLTCFESNGMAMACQICQSEGRMVVRLHAAGRTLDQIRAAVDARFGDG
ncbi:MAG TPA: hypothetical protein VGA37_16465 [Gemmatimonadales bacterium]